MKRKVKLPSGYETVTWDGRSFTVPESIMEEWEDRYPNVKREAIHDEIDKAAIWATETGRRLKVPRLFLTNWLDKQFRQHTRQVAFEQSMAVGNARILDELENG